MLIHVGETGTICTSHDTDEFEGIQANVAISLRESWIRSRPCRIAPEPGADYLDPMVHTSEAARYLLKVAEVGRKHLETSTMLAQYALECALRQKNGCVQIPWADADTVRSLRTHFLCGMMLKRFERGESYDPHELSPENAVFDGLVVTGQLFNREPADAILIAEQYNAPILAALVTPAENDQ